MKELRTEHLQVDKLYPFKGHPFKVLDNEEMDQLVESILAQGVLTPLVVRPQWYVAFIFFMHFLPPFFGFYYNLDEIRGKLRKYILNTK